MWPTCSLCFSQTDIVTVAMTKSYSNLNGDKNGEREGEHHKGTSEDLHLDLYFLRQEYCSTF